MQNNQHITSILKTLSIDSLNQMQLDMLDAFNNSDDILLLSPTGSGKTLGFLLPILNSIQPEIKKVQILILVPARELAIQIEAVFKSMKTDFKVNSCYGGHPLKIERNNLQTPPAVLIGTPGRIADHIEKQTFELDAVHTIIFDEFDKSLEFGFNNEMAYIVKNMPNVKRRILTSATQAISIPDFVGVRNCKKLNYLNENKIDKQLTINKIISDDVDKLEVFIKLLCNLESHEPTIVFANHREVVERIAANLSQNGLVCACFHGKLDQQEREYVLAKFKNGSTHLLITTDLAARGLDISEVKNIIHYQKPTSEEIYTHRNGRTARMNSSGNVFLILTTKEEIPAFLDENIPVLELKDDLPLPQNPDFVTITINKGKKDNINKMDIVGFLSKIGNLTKEELGMIEVKDYLAYAAVKSDKVKSVLKNIQNQKIKNKIAKFTV